MTWAANRVESRAILAQGRPAGKTVLLAGPSTGPELRMTGQQLQRRQTGTAGSRFDDAVSRQVLFLFFLEAHVDNVAAEIARLDDLPNYITKLERLLRSGALKVRAGTVQQVEVRHDSWCRIFRGAACSCDPTIELRKEDYT